MAYHDTVAGNQGGAYRSDDVDIEAITGGYTLAYIRDTEWTQYTVTVQQAGDYRVGLRAAAWNGPRTVRVLAGTTEIGTVTVPLTGSSTTFATATTTVRLAAGTQALRFAYTGDGMNLDRIETALVTPTATPTPTPTPTAVPEAPYPAAHVLPGRSRPSTSTRAARASRTTTSSPRTSATTARRPARAWTSRRTAGSPTSASSAPAST